MSENTKVIKYTGNLEAGRSAAGYVLKGKPFRTREGLAKGLVANNDHEYVTGAELAAFEASEAKPAEVAPTAEELQAAAIADTDDAADIEFEVEEP
jgi:hypothetical protein